MTERDLAGTLRALRLDITELQRARRGGGGGTPGPPGPPGLRGTTAQRDALFPPPSTDAQRAALANQQVRFFNETLGWEQSYYAALGTPGLSVRGLQVDVPAGWYATGGSTRIRASLRAPQPIDEAAEVAALMLDEKVGSGTVVSGTVRPNEAGRYLLDYRVLMSGGAFPGTVAFSLSGDGGGGNRYYPDTPFVLRTGEMLSVSASTVVHLWPNDTLNIIVIPDSAPTGSPTLRGVAWGSATFLGLNYIGPLLQGN